MKEPMATPGYLGIDAGTQGLSVVFVDENSNVLATGEGGYEMLPGLPESCYEQHPADWELALSAAMNELRSKLATAKCDYEVLAIGISGQMHGEVLIDENGAILGAVRLWCDCRNEAEGIELTTRFGVKIPKRMTAARWLWTIRNQAEKARLVANITTPAGWISNRLTGQWLLGIGDASGMFPIDQATLDFDERFLKSFDELVNKSDIGTLRSLLPAVRRVGADAGSLNRRGAELLGLPIGVPVAPAEGDQPASLAGSLIGAAGMVSVSFGTSVCANSVGDRAFVGVSDVVDHFCAPDGKPINMVFLRNGTTFMNTIMDMFGAAMGGNRNEAFESIMPTVVDAAADCGGLMALPFMDDEPGLGVNRGGSAMLYGLNANNSSPGNAVKAALLCTMFNLRLGSEVLDQRGFPRHEIVLSGGLTRTPALAQVLADVMNTPVTMLSSSAEGCAWGAALMAKYRRQFGASETGQWEDFLRQHDTATRQQFTPNRPDASVYDSTFLRYQELIKTMSLTR